MNFKSYSYSIRSFGLKNGLKMILKGWQSHFTDKKEIYCLSSPKLNGRSISLRINTTDAHIAQAILGVDGDYDVIGTIPAIEKAECIVDAGANIGLFSAFARVWAPKARIIAIEPDTANFEMCRRNIPQENSKIYHAGIWNKETMLDIHSRSTGEVGFTVTESPTGEIQAVSMSSIIKENAIIKIDILKIDIEGSEYEIFDDSADEWIDKVDVMIIEFHDRIKEGCSERVKKKMEMHHFQGESCGENYIFRKCSV